MDNKDYLYALNRMKKMAEEYAKEHFEIIGTAVNEEGKEITRFINQDRID